MPLLLKLAVSEYYSGQMNGNENINLMHLPQLSWFLILQP